jgi:signal peptidase
MATLKKIWSITSTVLVAIIVLFALFLMGSRLIGYRCYNVISPSMEPLYKVGDLIYVKKVDPYKIKVGDVITFLVDENLVVGTHRVVRIDVEKQHFYTKGDANDVEDGEPVHFNNVIGVPQFSIPKLGYVSDFVQNPPGMFITMGIGALLLLAIFLPDLIVKKKEDVKENKEEITEAEAEAAKAEIDAANEENERLKAELEKLRAELADKKTE